MPFLLIYMNTVFTMRRRHRGHRRHIHFHHFIVLWWHIRGHCHGHYAKTAEEGVSHEPYTNEYFHAHLAEL
jgi:hypothetical protein